jgi:hypothetical protein
VDLEVVEGPSAFPFADYDGLAVTPDDLPPLLSPSMLMDPEGYSAWERHMVQRCCGDVSPERVVATLRSDAAQLSTWRPGPSPLVEAIQRLPGSFNVVSPHGSLVESVGLRDEVIAAIPEDLRPAAGEDGLEDAYVSLVLPMWRSFQRPINRYLAAKAFASWTAYQGRGLATIVRGLEAALAFLRVEASRQCRDARRPLDRDLLLEAIRTTDFALNHLAGGEELAEAWSRAENQQA